MKFSLNYAMVIAEVRDWAGAEMKMEHSAWNFRQVNRFIIKDRWLILFVAFNVTLVVYNSREINA